MKNCCLLATLSLFLVFILLRGSSANCAYATESTAGASNQAPFQSADSEKSKATDDPAAVSCVHVGETHILKVPVTVNGTHKSQFILDTGAGVNLISKELAKTLGLKVSEITEADECPGRR